MWNALEIVAKLKILLRSPSPGLSIHDLGRSILSRYKHSLQGRTKISHGKLSKSMMSVVDAINASKSSRLSKGNTLYLLDETAAKKFASLVLAERKSRSSHIIEINPGMGYLTKELLLAEVPRIQVFEGVDIFHSGLESLKTEYSDKLCLEKVDFYHTWNLGYADWKEGTAKLDVYFHQITKREWNEKPAIEIIGSLADMKFLHRFIGTIVYQTTLCKYGRIVLYVAVPPSIWAQLTCTNEHYDLYRSRSIMFQTLFQYELLGSLPRSVFYPNRKPFNSRTRNKCRLKIRQNDVFSMNIVKIEPRADIFTDDFTKKDLMLFYYFVNQHLRSRTKRVIPALENWIPGCGRTLIAQGYNIFTEFGELSPLEIFNLFKQFRSWPDFKRSTFKSCMETFLERVDEQITFDTYSDESDSIFDNSVNHEQHETLK